MLCHIVIRPYISQQIFEKFSNIKFHENPSIGTRIVPCGQTVQGTHRHDGAYSRFAQFCYSA